MKKCYICKKKPAAYPTDKRSRPCADCESLYIKARRKTVPGFLSRAYSNLQYRCKTKTKKYWYGKKYLTKEEFIQWSMNNKQFLHCFKIWTLSGHKNFLSPSVNRIDSDEGYVLGNIEWITHSLNSSLAGNVRKHNNLARKSIYNVLGVTKTKKVK